MCYRVLQQEHRGFAIIEPCRRDGSYCRFSEDFTERIYTDEFLSELVKSNDFELIGKYDGFEDSPVNDKTQRVLYVCRRINRG